MNYKIITLVAILLLTLNSCATPPEEKSSENKNDNVLTNYVKTPLDQAKGAAGSLNKETDRLNQESQQGE